MKKNKIVLFLSGILSLAFLGYVFILTRDIGTTEKRISESANVVDVTDKIRTQILVSHQDLAPEAWITNHLNEADWKEIKIPQYRIVQESEFKEGNFAYYRILVPKSTFESLAHIRNELFLALQYIHFNKLEIYLNGSFYRSNSPKNYVETMINVPLDYSQDNLVGIKGYIKTGDSGINHRGRIFAGKGGELNELYLKSYKSSVVFYLIYILSKGSVFFVFFLIFLVMQVERYFEKFLLYGFFVILEDLLIGGEYISHLFNLNQQVYLFNLVNLGILLFLFLFFSDILNKHYSRKALFAVFGGFTALAYIISFDFLYFSLLFNVSNLLTMWNVALLIVLAFFSSKIYKLDKSLFVFLLVAFVLVAWSTFFSANIGFNLKLLANLLIFFMAAYQTFAQFRREQVLLQENQRQMLEQEKDVAIGRTAALLAHDVRKPLEHMSFILNQIASGNNSREFIDTAKRDVDSSLNNVQGQINDIMNYSRTKELALEPISFYRILASAIKQVMAVNRDVSLNLMYDFDNTRKVQGDESRLSSVLTNLISNSVEAIRDIGKRSSGNICFSTRIEDGMFVFTIFNDGPVIPEDILPEIFKPLFTYGKNQGTGLGLASVFKIIRDHQGEISVRNIRSEGVEFKLLLKLTPLNDVINENEFLPINTDYQTMPNRPEKIIKDRSLRIFLLDDDGQVHEYFKFIVSNLNFDVKIDFATDWETGLELIKSKRYDLYVLDYDIGPHHNGLDFYRAHLNFLSHEVVIHTNRDKEQIHNLPVEYQSKPISEKAMATICEQVYQKRSQILVVDDSELTLLAWSIFHGDHNLTGVGSPEEALKLLASKPETFNLCVVDYYFNNSAMNGLELAEQIRKLYPAIMIIIASDAEIESAEFKVIPKSHFETRTLKFL